MKQAQVLINEANFAKHFLDKKGCFVAFLTGTHIDLMEGKKKKRTFNTETKLLDFLENKIKVLHQELGFPSSDLNYYLSEYISSIIKQETTNKHIYVSTFFKIKGNKIIFDISLTNYMENTTILQYHCKTKDTERLDNLKDSRLLVTNILTLKHTFDTIKWIFLDEFLDTDI